MFAAADEGLSFALATIVAADGGPRPVGAQMVVTETDSWGFLSGGCIESDVARNGREVIRDGRVRTLVYGRSEEHTSELQSLMRISYAVFCLKKKKTNYSRHLIKPELPDNDTT